MNWVTKLSALSVLGLCTLATPGCTGKEATDAVNKAGEFTKEKKDAVEKEVSDHLAMLDTKIKDLTEQAKTATGDAKKKADEQLAKLTPLRDEVAKHLEDVKNATAESWKKLTDGAESASEKLKAKIHEATEPKSETH
ncbi:MAG: hypothetical protein SGJ20_18985 [Planctomycetota bacterium]|nr:hypothetical protein [Planctomycetota bacterium]